MKIRTKIATIIIATTVCLCAIIAITFSFIFSHHYVRIETNLMQQNLDRIQFTFNEELGTLTRMASNWSVWDDTYRFMEDKNQEYIQSNLGDPAFIDSEISIICFINPSGEIVYIKGFDPEKEVTIEISVETQKALTDSFFLSENNEKGKQGVLKTAEGPLLFTVNPILTSQGQGPVHGTLIMGRFLDNNLIRELSTSAQVAVTFDQLADIASGNNPQNIPLLSIDNPVSIHPLDSNTLEGYFLIPDIYGKPYLVAGTQAPLSIYNQGKNMITWMIIGIVLVAVLIILVILILLDRTILSRLRILGQFAINTGQTEKFSSRVHLDGHDELTVLGDEMNDMLTRLSDVNQRLLESENRYSALVEQSNDGILITSNDLTTAYANPRILQLTGFTREEAIGKPFTDFIAPDNRTFVEKCVQERISGKRKAEIYEANLLCKDLKVIPIEINAKVITINGQTCDMVVIRDISIRKQDERELEILYQKETAQRKELEEEAKTRSQFINVIAHELRTPLTPIMISVEMARDLFSSNPESVQYKIIKNALDGTESLRNRLEELLDLARFSRGSFSLKIGTINTSEFLKTVTQRYKPAIEKKNQQLIIDVPSNLPKIEADASRLEQVILNLLSNASKYSPEKTNIIFQASAMQNEILVEIKDHGIGISAEDQKNLFLPYHRVHQDRQSYPGIGLGLAITKQIVDAHGGSIWIESEVGKGSIFKFVLPLNPNKEIIHPSDNNMIS